MRSATAWHSRRTSPTVHETGSGNDHSISLPVGSPGNARSGFIVTMMSAPLRSSTVTARGIRLLRTSHSSGRRRGSPRGRRRVETGPAYLPSYPTADRWSRGDDGG